MIPDINTSITENLMCHVENIVNISICFIHFDSDSHFRMFQLTLRMNSDTYFFVECCSINICEFIYYVTKHTTNTLCCTKFSKCPTIENLNIPQQITDLLLYCVCENNFVESK